MTVHGSTESANLQAARQYLAARFTIPIGSVQPGGELRARFAVVLDYRDGRIAAQRNYDCFDPF